MPSANRPNRRKKKSRVATPYDDTGEPARLVNLLETWELVSRRGQRGNPLANGQNSSWAKLTVDKTVGYVQSGHSEDLIQGSSCAPLGLGSLKR